MWNELTKDFPYDLYYNKVKYLYKNNFDNSHYVFIPYSTSTGKRVNIVLKVSIRDKYKSCLLDSKELLTTRSSSYIKRYFNLDSYRYIDSFRKIY